MLVLLGQPYVRAEQIIAMEVAKEVFWKLVKGELRQQLMSYADDLNVDLMHQGGETIYKR